MSELHQVLQDTHGQVFEDDHHTVIKAKWGTEVIDDERGPLILQRPDGSLLNLEGVDKLIAFVRQGLGYMGLRDQARKLLEECDV